jgi:hypothetical protein
MDEKKKPIFLWIACVGDGDGDGDGDWDGEDEWNE